ncbi:MAG TPA: Fur family transcriptional regulator [Ktedonobacterales bacterium]|nr:Fur family transcriptional regulator [Ktedonobacterales bacterium]
MSITADDIYSAFEEMGLRNTRPRRLIAEKLADFAAAGRDFATDELWSDLKRVDAELGRATVFRAVDLLVEQGILDRVAFADGSHRFRVCGRAADHHHHHLTCTRCRRVEEVDACLSPSVLDAIGHETGFTLEGHAVELFGLCPACRRS